MYTVATAVVMILANVYCMHECYHDRNVSLAYI